MPISKTAFAQELEGFVKRAPLNESLPTVVAEALQAVPDLDKIRYQVGQHPAYGWFVLLETPAGQTVWYSERKPLTEDL